MLISISLILILGFIFGEICKKVRFPALFGMIIAGVLIGPSGFNLLDSSILSISSDIRRIALIIILIRAGLKLNVSDLKKVGKPAIMMCFVPASIEIIGTVLIAPILLNISTLDAAILGAVIAAVSPAVVVPRMIKLIDENRGTKDAVPQMILAGASVDDVFVIVMFTTFTEIAKGEKVSVMNFIGIPISIILGIVVGVITGILIHFLFTKLKISTIFKVILVFAISLILNWLEGTLSVVPFAGLIAIMSLGTAINKKDNQMAKSLSSIFDKAWVVAEIFLFVLVGASVAIDSAKSAGLSAILLIFIVLIFRMFGVFLCVAGTKLSIKEKIFTMLAYTPKATVQAAIGGLPLAMGLGCGQIVLTVSVIAIMLTAPLGAFAIDLTYKKLLPQN